jgi:hypothetical protein
VPFGDETMKFLGVLALTLFSTSVFGQNSELQIISAIESKEAEKLTDYINGELWGYHSGPIGNPSTSSTLKSQGTNSYQIKNVYDLDLTTAWVEGVEGTGIGESFEFKIQYRENEQFGSPYHFYGIIEIFNGYCKSEKLWTENSRVKKLKVFLNAQPICLIELIDTWQYQSVDIRQFFKEPNWFPNAPYEIKNNDVLKFEILEIYQGTKYLDTAISEFVADSPPN